MRNILKYAAALSVAATPLAAIAQEQATPEFTEPEQESINRAGLIFSLFGAALRTEEIPAEEKSGLISCLYGNPLKNISLETGRVLSLNPQLDTKDQSVIYAAAATICGARQQPAQAGDAEAAPQR